MSEAFDPYHRWLGIPPREQPANHYRLLGVSLWESDPEVIRDSAARQMAHVRTYQLGPNSPTSQKILNELAAAKACLSDPERRAAYEQRLRAELAAANPAPPPAPPAQPVAPPVPPAALPPMPPGPLPPAPPIGPPPVIVTSPGRWRPIAAGMAAGAVVLAAAVVLALLFGGHGNEKQLARDATAESVQAGPPAQPPAVEKSTKESPSPAEVAAKSPVSAAVPQALPAEVPATTPSATPQLPPEPPPPKAEPRPASPEAGRSDAPMEKSDAPLWSERPPVPRRKPKPPPLDGGGFAWRHPNVTRTEMAGGKGGGEFADTYTGAFLVGMNLTTRHFAGHLVIASVQSIYLTRLGRATSRAHGKADQTIVSLQARPGYAVGGIVGRSGDRLDGVKLIFMRIDGNRLNPDDSYESEWVGGEGGHETRLVSDGKPVVGVFGKCGAEMDGIGLELEQR